jgi:hypothetical protein
VTLVVAISVALVATLVLAGLAFLVVAAAWGGGSMDESLPLLTKRRAKRSKAHRDGASHKPMS